MNYGIFFLSTICILLTSCSHTQETKDKNTSAAKVAKTRALINQLASKNKAPGNLGEPMESFEVADGQWITTLE